MLDFFTHFKIKHADLPYMLVYLIIFIAVILIGLATAKITTVILMAVCCLPILILLLNYHFFRASEAIAVRQQQKNQAYFSLYNLIDFNLPLPYMTGWAATPELALAIFEIIKTQKPEQIVELGSGISSLICAYTMNDNKKGTLFSLDHDKEYGDKTRQMLLDHSVADRVTVCHAPLKSQVFEKQKYIWYDCAAAPCPEKIDLLIVDGPPVQTQSKARRPALHYFYPKLSSSATILIHDAFRDEERAIVDGWIKDYPEFTRETVYSEKGITILRR